MRTVGTFLVALFLANFTFAQSFEGVITMNTSNSEMKEEASITWYQKGDRSRMDIVSQAGEYNTEYSIISDGKGTHMVSQGHVTDVPQSALKSDVATQSLVSETKGVKMNGFDCDQIVYTDGVNRTVYWLTDGLGITYNDLPAFIKKNMPSVSSNGFPVRMEKRNKDGKVILSQDVISVQASTVDESKFKRN